MKYRDFRPTEPPDEHPVRDALILAAVLLLVGAAVACSRCEAVAWLLPYC